jgi:hypothetical protein
MWYAKKKKKITAYFFFPYRKINVVSTALQSVHVLIAVFKHSLSPGVCF